MLNSPKLSCGFKHIDSPVTSYFPTKTQARSQGGGGRWGQSPPPKKKKKKKKCHKKKEGEREKKKENKVACMHVKLPPFNHFQSKIKYKFVLYEENTGHMQQIAPLTTSKCKKLSLWEGVKIQLPECFSCFFGYSYDLRLYTGNVITHHLCIPSPEVVNGTSYMYYSLFFIGLLDVPKKWK